MPALRGQSVLVIVGEYLFYRRICESPACSTCNLGLNCPRRNLFAPFGFVVEVRPEFAVMKRDSTAPITCPDRVPHKY